MAMPTGTQVVTCMTEHCVSGMVGGDIGGSIASHHHDCSGASLVTEAMAGRLLHKAKNAAMIDYGFETARLFLRSENESDMYTLDTFI